MPLVHKPPKVVSHVSQKHPYAVPLADKSQITVLACASASGYTIPPMVVFDRKQLQAEMTDGEVPGAFYGLSDSGWMDAVLFEQWFTHHFSYMFLPFDHFYSSLMAMYHTTIPHS